MLGHRIAERRATGHVLTFQYPLGMDFAFPEKDHHGFGERAFGPDLTGRGSDLFFEAFPQVPDALGILAGTAQPQVFLTAPYLQQGEVKCPGFKPTGLRFRPMDGLTELPLQAQLMVKSLGPPGPDNVLKGGMVSLHALADTLGHPGVSGLFFDCA